MDKINWLDCRLIEDGRTVKKELRFKSLKASFSTVFFMCFWVICFILALVTLPCEFHVAGFKSYFYEEISRVYIENDIANKKTEATK
jgi:hypothetical protein